MKTWSKTDNGLRLHHPSKTWYLNVKVSGRNVSRSTGSNSKAEAVKFRDEFLAAARLPGAVEQAAKLKNGITLAPYLAHYLGSIEFKPKVRSPLTLDRKQREVRYIEQSWQEFRGAPLAGEDPRTWSVLDLQKFQKFLSGRYAATVVNKYIRVLVVVLQLVEDDITSFRSPHRHRDFTHLETPPPARLVLPSHEQFAAVLQYIRTEASNPKREHTADLAEGLAYSGLRHDEALRLLTDHVDLKNRRLNLPKEIVKGKYSPKETGRSVPLAPAAVELFRRLVLQAGGRGKPVFKSPSCKRALARACKAVGIQRLCHHKLRHWWATRVLETIGDFKQVSEWLGHKDGGKLAATVYTHTRAEREAELAARLDFDWTAQPQEKKVA